MSDAEIGGTMYRIGKMKPLKAGHVASKLAGVLMFLSNMKREDGTEGDSREFAKALCASTSDLSPIDRDAAMFACLAAVQRRSGDSWANLVAADGRSLMFEDIDFDVLYELTWLAIKEARIPDFYRASPVTPSAGQA